MVRRRRSRKWLPKLDNQTLKAVGCVVIGIAGWYDARTKPDIRTDALAALATTQAETSVSVAEQLESLRRDVATLKLRTRKLEPVYGPEEAPASYKPESHGLLWKLKNLGRH